MHTLERLFHGLTDEPVFVLGQSLQRGLHRLGGLERLGRHLFANLALPVFSLFSDLLKVARVHLLHSFLLQGLLLSDLVRLLGMLLLQVLKLLLELGLQRCRLFLLLFKLFNLLCIFNLKGLYLVF